MSKKLKTYLRQDVLRKIGDERSLVAIRVEKLSVANANDLRKALRKEGARLTVVRNRIGRRALDEIGIGAAGSVLKGMSAIAYGGPDGALGVARAISDWTKKNKEAGVEILGGFMDGQVLNPAEVEALAGLPGKPQLLAMIASAVSAPMQSIASQVNELLAGVARAVDAVRESKEKAA